MQTDVNQPPRGLAAEISLLAGGQEESSAPTAAHQAKVLQALNIADTSNLLLASKRQDQDEPPKGAMPARQNP